MPKIVIKNIEDATLETNETDLSVLDIIHSNYIDWMHACGKKGRCTTCKMIVIKGIDNITDHNELEKKIISLGKLKENERLACQCQLKSGDIEIAVPRENQLPHMRYVDY